VAQRKADPTQFIAQLEAALKVARKTDIEDANGMADILRMTWRNLLETYIKPDADFPILEVGREGTPYRFEVVKVLRHMLKRCREIVAQNSRRNADRMRLTGYDVPENDSGISTSELKEIAAMTIMVQKQRREQGGFVPAEKVEQFLGAYNQRVRDLLLGSGGVIDPTGELEPEQRTAFDEHMRDGCLALEAALSAFIEEHCAGFNQAAAI
jgi:hypothetical protein